MTKSTFDDGVLSHPKMVEAGEDATDLWMRSVIYCNKYGLGVALDDLRRDLRDKREDEHATHGAAFRKLASTALRGAAACARRAAGGAR